jgi:sugar/nucleoside kinase (ribokinase family)
MFGYTFLLRPIFPKFFAMKSIDVLGIGNALVDIQAQVDESFLKTVGFDKGVMTLVDDVRQQSVLAHLGKRPLNRCAGGSAANTIVGLAQLGGSGAFIGKVGKDEIGDFFSEDMGKFGIEVNPGSADLPSGTCAVLITPDAQRTMLTNLGAAGLVSADDVDVNLVKRAKYVYVEGYLLLSETGKAAAYRLMDLAKANNVKVALTASDPFLVNILRDEMWELLHGPVDLFFCNEEEAKSLTGKDDPVACGAEIHRHAENVALTLGPNGSILMHGGEAIAIEGVDIKAVDTTGAGDMYAGALLYGITSGKSWKAAGHLASHAAARVVAQLGARLDHTFTPEEVEHLTS